MFRKSHTPHATLVKEVSNGTYEVIDEFRSIGAALKYIRPEMFTSKEIRQLRVVEYLGNNLYRMNSVAVDRWAVRRAPERQMTLF